MSRYRNIISASAARARLSALAAHPAEAYAAAKRELRDGVTDVPAAERERFAREALGAWVSPELRVRIAAVLRK
ncbi:MAG: hypothetical protein AABZ30_07620 [Myxococcota bacterium]